MKECYKECYKIIATILLAFIAFIAWAHIYDQEVQCSSKGGERLRSLFGSFECYDKDSLRKK